MVKEHFGFNLILFLFTYNQGFFTKGEKGGRGRFFNNSVLVFRMQNRNPKKKTDPR